MPAIRPSATRPSSASSSAAGDEQTELLNTAVAAVRSAQCALGASVSAVHLVLELPTMPVPGVVPNHVSFDIAPLVSQTLLCGGDRQGFTEAYQHLGIALTDGRHHAGLARVPHLVVNVMPWRSRGICAAPRLDIRFPCAISGSAMGMEVS
jgi:hypothetical protein